jgi:hypothetical protein
VEKPFFEVFRGLQQRLIGQRAWAVNYWNVAHSQPEKGVSYGTGILNAAFGAFFFLTRRLCAVILRLYSLF